MKYRFDKEKHLHQILKDGEWKNLTGCTTILSVVAKPYLIQWAANVAVEYIGTNIMSFYKDDRTFDLKEFNRILSEAKTAHCKRKEKAGDYGTKAHERVELLITEAITDNGGLIKEPRKSKDKSIQNFIDWAFRNKVKFLATEKNVYSEDLFLGGIVDFICEIGGEIWIGDIKTSKSGIYPINFAQMAGYDLMMKEMELPFAKDIKGYIVINLKESGEFDEKRSVSNENNINFFLACLEIYRQQERIKQQTL
jgi:hypothetical protein